MRPLKLLLLFLLLANRGYGQWDASFKAYQIFIEPKNADSPEKKSSVEIHGLPLSGPPVPNHEANASELKDAHQLAIKTSKPVETMLLCAALMKGGERDFVMKHLMLFDDPLAASGTREVLLDPSKQQDLAKLTREIVSDQPVFLLQKGSDLVEIYSWTKGPNYEILESLLFRLSDGGWKMVPQAVIDDGPPEDAALKNYLISAHGKTSRATQKSRYTLVPVP